MPDELSSEVRNSLHLIEPSVLPPGNILLYPCSATLRDGTIFERVYFTTRISFRQMTRRDHPDEIVPGLSISPGEVVSIRESPSRLPARFANEIYHAGETGPGHMAFTLVFCRWFRRNYAVPGTMVDFLEYPLWLGPRDITSVRLFPRERHLRSIPVVRWCIF